MSTDNETLTARINAALVEGTGHVQPPHIADQLAKQLPALVDDPLAFLAAFTFPDRIRSQQLARSILNQAKMTPALGADQAEVEPVYGPAARKAARSSAPLHELAAHEDTWPPADVPNQPGSIPWTDGQHETARRIVLAWRMHRRDEITAEWAYRLTYELAWALFNAGLQTNHLGAAYWLVHDRLEAYTRRDMFPGLPALLPMLKDDAPGWIRTERAARRSAI